MKSMVQIELPEVNNKDVDLEQVVLMNNQLLAIGSIYDKKAHKFNLVAKKLSEEGNPVGIKGLMGIMGLCSNQVRLPLVNASSNLINQMKKILENDIFSLK